jgi:uncharacterized membrane protein YoaK (UPF0700 family)
MLIVFSMGVQNTVTRLYANSVFGPTTVMTGNVTKAILDFFSYISTQHTVEKLIELKKSLVLLTGFLTVWIHNHHHDRKQQLSLKLLQKTQYLKVFS